MGSAITVKVSTNTFQEGFNKLLKKTKNLEPLMLDIGEYLVAETDDRFDEEKGPDGKKWKQSQRAKRDNGKTLTDYRILRDSITHIADNKSVLVGAKGDYVAIHQFGGKAGRGLKSDIPARPFLGINDENEAEIKIMVSDYLLKVSK